MDVGTVLNDTQPRVERSVATEALTGGDFLQLLATQLTNQDPLEPTSNESLMQQLASIRDIELSTTLVDSLKSLTGSERYGSAASLIGKHVTGRLQDGSTEDQTASGIVVGVRFGADSAVALELDNGQLLPVESVTSVTEARRAAESLLGQLVRGISRSQGHAGELIEGIVTTIGDVSDGSVALELDTGEQLLLRDLIQNA